MDRTHETVDAPIDRMERRLDDMTRLYCDLLVVLELEESRIRQHDLSILPAIRTRKEEIRDQLADASARFAAILAGAGIDVSGRTDDPDTLWTLLPEKAADRLDISVTVVCALSESAARAQADVRRICAESGVILSGLINCRSGGSRENGGMSPVSKLIRDLCQRNENVLDQWAESLTVLENPNNSDKNDIPTNERETADENAA